jgi:hypothetical protein
MQAVELTVIKNLPTASFIFVRHGLPCGNFFSRGLPFADKVGKHACRERNAFSHGVDKIVLINLQETNRQFIGLLRVILDVEGVKLMLSSIVVCGWDVERHHMVFRASETKTGPANRQIHHLHVVHFHSLRRAP